MIINIVAFFEASALKELHMEFCLFISLLGPLSPSDSSRLQAPRFITPPSASGSTVAEGRTKILQCQALGEQSSPQCKG